MTYIAISSRTPLFRQATCKRCERRIREKKPDKKADTTSFIFSLRDHLRFVGGSITRGVSAWLGMAMDVWRSQRNKESWKGFRLPFFPPFGGRVKHHRIPGAFFGPFSLGLTFFLLWPSKHGQGQGRLFRAPWRLRRLFTRSSSLAAGVRRRPKSW